MKDLSTTYCNPLPIPEIPIGRGAYDADYYGPWWREFGDPSVIRFRGKYYLFPSCAMVWESDDLLHWRKCSININDLGWAPSVTEKNGRLYLTASWEGSQIWTATDPLGHWECLGEIIDDTGKHLSWADPCLFTDVDGTMYAYYSLGANRGIWGVPLKDDDPTHFATAPTHFFEFHPEHSWECFGEFKQNPYISHLEGASMTRFRGKYYLQYSSGGAEWKSYPVGCYVSDHPLGPFRLQKKNPILIHRGGMINGCAHNCTVEDEQGNLWCFYSIMVRRYRGIERRIGMDIVRFDENGEMYVDGPTETPVHADGSLADCLPLTVGQPVTASSYLPDHEPDLAVDNYIRTFYQAAPGDSRPSLTVDLLGAFHVGAVRIIFNEKITPGNPLPADFRFLVEGSMYGKQFFPLIDCREKEFSGPIRYETFPIRETAFMRLTITGYPPGNPPGVIDFCAFGKASRPGYRPLTA